MTFFQEGIIRLDTWLKKNWYDAISFFIIIVYYVMQAALRDTYTTFDKDVMKNY